MTETVSRFLDDPVFFVAVLTWMVTYVFNSAVQALPDPDMTSSKKYVFFFRFMHALAANINVARKKRKGEL
jgi:hypothetical protein